MSVDGEMLAHMIRPVLADSERMAVLIVVDVPKGSGPYVLKHETTTIIPDDVSAWPLAKVAHDWAVEILGRVP